MNLPIACVDLLPVQRDDTGRVSHVGLIERDSPMGRRWCHLGGRVGYDESLQEAGRRHLEDSLRDIGGVVVETEPYFVNQYFPSPRAGMGVDPRKHAVAVCYLALFPSGSAPRAQGSEALNFQWFPVDALPDDDDFWPGSLLMIRRPEVTTSGWHDEVLTYQSISDRYISHNELMWQTPVLAMTAMAFLLTIALGQSASWMRALAAALSFVIAVISAQLMAKHSKSQISDSEDLLRIEKKRGMQPAHDKPKPVRIPFRFSTDGLSEWFAARRSRIWWFRALLLLAVVSAGVTVEAVVAIFR
ncbi:hypothetical protein JCM9957A_67310 [Kineosporia succinea]|uniref:ADP-ribose pyrophosphatase YjhB (NUDIX family) n=2 Tax=Kineosporia succinea TaxID=84632 RepID=A0ABT9P5E2_9ACTN|nr:ADP-ribose pyrophosphatase YjhB (NUDIX family) [Kineosporia succinea]